jgi:hypothetical protein
MWVLLRLQLAPGFSLILLVIYAAVLKNLPPSSEYLSSRLQEETSMATRITLAKGNIMFEPINNSGQMEAIREVFNAFGVLAAFMGMLFSATSGRAALLLGLIMIGSGGVVAGALRRAPHQLIRLPQPAIDDYSAKSKLPRAA